MARRPGQLVLLHLGLIPGIVVTVGADPTVVFYTDRTVFEVGVSSIVTDGHEGIVEDDAFVHVLNHVGETVRFPGLTTIAGRNAGVTGAPFDSAILFDDDAVELEAFGATAVGAWFGSVGSNGSSSTLRVYGESGLLDTRQVIAGDMGLGSNETFYGWRVFGDAITRIVHDTDGPIAGVDDVVTGDAEWFGASGVFEMHPVAGGATDFGSCQATTTFVPGSFGLLTFDIWLRTGRQRLSGASGVEFRISGGESLPSWVSNAVPDPSFACVGNPIFPVGGTHVCACGFSCIVSDLIFLYRVTYLSETGAADIAPDTRLRIEAGNPPSNPSFDCPLVILCDSPVFTTLCSEGTEFIINPVALSCAFEVEVPTDVGLLPRQEPSTWGRVKGFYR